MSSLTENHDPRLKLFSIPLPIGQPFAYVFGILAVILVVYATNDKTKLPEHNPQPLLGFLSSRVKKEFIQKSKELFVTGRARYPHEAYKLNTYLGQAIVLPPNLINEVRNEPGLDFMSAASFDHHSHLQGFEPFQQARKLPKLINRHLTKALNKLTKPLSNETTLVLRQKLTDSSEWHEISPSRDMLIIISRLSTRVFMGEELCRNEEWLEASTKYVAAAFPTVEVLRKWPAFLRPIVHWALPECKTLRERLQDCRDILQPYIDARRARQAAAQANGERIPVYDDSLEWFEKEYDHYDPATNQIQLALFAIHTTSDLLQETMINIARNPELFKPLREEVVQVLSREGLKKTALFNLKLMDSVLKEAQRLKPVNMALQRRAVKDLKLSNGLTIRKGQRVWMDTSHMWDSAYWENPEQFDGYRFLRLRGTKKDHTAHLVSTSPEHTGFGHGEHACPGRFFAANEIKILLCHLLLKYEWRLPEGHDPHYLVVGLPLVGNPEAKLLIRRRKEELDFDALEC